MNKAMIFSCCALLLAACAEKAHDVQWYLDHPEEHEAQLAKCSNNPGKLESTEACINAREAALKRATGLGHFKKGVGLSGQ